jgi:lipoate-protein ligase A
VIRGVPRALHLRDAREEQAWIARQLREPVRSPQLRFSLYARPAVVLGASQRVDEALLRRATAHGAQLCRRESGGGAVLAGPWMLGVTAVLPAAHPGAIWGIVGAYRWFGRAHARALAAIGVRCGCAAPSRCRRADPSSSWACFGQVSPWEVVVGRRKIAGLCQVRRRGGIVLSSGILIGTPPWNKLCEIMQASPRQARMLSRRTVSCGQVLARPVDPVRLAAGLRRELRAVLRPGSAPR